ncbi:MAG: CAP domain-containing protein [Desulfobaccales bacterium]
MTLCPGLPAVDQLLTPPVVQHPKTVLAPPGVKHLPKVEDLVCDLTNRFRQAHGLPPLAKDEELRNAAQAYSDDMLVRGFFDHTTPDGLSFDERISNHYPHRFHVVGENIWSAFGYNPAKIQYVAKEIVDSWISSPGHRANLLSADYTHLGVGVSARQQTIRATQEFVGKSKAFSFREVITFIKGKVPSSWLSFES